MNGAVSDLVGVIIKYSGEFADIAVGVDGTVEDLGAGYAVVTLPRDGIADLANIDGIEDVELSREVFIEDDFALSAACISSARAEFGGLDGGGVAVGIIDTGVDYAHPEFVSDDGGSRIAYFWDQNADGVPPAGFAFGTEYTADDLNGALGAAQPYSVIARTDLRGHGTAVASIAAGNSGAAPRSAIIAVAVRRGELSGGSPTTDIMRALKYTIDRARELSMPLACNISFGLNDGSHRGDSLFETYITDVLSSWKCSAAVPTGNEGSSGHHASGELTNGEVRDVAFFTTRGISRFYLSLWKNYADEIDFELVFPNGESSGIISESDAVRRLARAGFDLTAVYGQPSRYSVRQEVFFNLAASDGDPADAGVWTLRLYAGNVPDGRFEVWLPTVGEVTRGTFFADPAVQGSLTIPSTAEKVISVAGLDARTGVVAEFSGAGYSFAGLPKPDLAAPAVGIVAARSGGGYASFSGTSFASPFVCGSAALLMQWGVVRGNSPFLYGERLRALLRRSAIRTRASGYPDPFVGYGALCLARALRIASDNAP